jgi:hypothetical protein
MTSDSGGSTGGTSDVTWDDADLKCVREFADDAVDTWDEAEDGTAMLRFVDEE